MRSPVRCYGTENALTNIPPLDFHTAGKMSKLVGDPTEMFNYSTNTVLPPVFLCELRLA